MRFFRRALVWGIFLGVLTGARAATEYLFPPWQVETFAGYTGSGSADGAAAISTFNEPSGIALDLAGNAYLTDTQNSTVRKLTAAGVVSTVAGTPGLAGIADGAAAGARFNLPFGLAAAADGTLYLADTANHLIRKITPSGVVTTLAGTAGLSGSSDATGASARFKSPTAIAHDSAAGVLYIADTGNHTIRRLDLASRAVTTLAGTAVVNGATVNASGASARFHGPIALALNAARSTLYVADQTGQTIRQIVITGAAVTTLAGSSTVAGSSDGTGTAARFDQPKGLALDGAGYLYISEANGCLIRRLQLSGNQVTTLAGGYRLADSVNATGTAARFNQPAGLAYDAAGSRLLVADALNAQVRALNLATLAVTTLAGPPVSKGATDGAGEDARFRTPRQLARDAAGNLYVADRDNHTLRKIAPDGSVSTLAGLAGSAATTDGTGAAARFNQPVGVAVTADGSSIYVSEAAGHVVRRVTSAGVVSTLAGLAGTSGTVNGTGTAARFKEPAGLALDPSGNVYVADFGNHAIRKITAPGGVVTTFAGKIGTLGSADGAGATSARFWFPFGLASDAAGNLYVADTYNQTIRKITPSAAVSTFAGAAGVNGSTDATTATAARFFYPYGVAVDANARVYVADYANHLVRRIDATGTVRTLAGTPAAPGGADGLASAARFRNPQGIVVAPDGATVFVSDTENSAIRVLFPLPVPVLTSPASATGTVDVSSPVYSINATHSPFLFGALGLPPGLVVDSATGAISGMPTQAGVWDATVTAENASGIGTAVVRFTIAKGAATLELSNLDQPFDGAPKTPASTTTPPGLPVVFTFNGSATAPSAYGTYDLVATINHANYQGSATATFRVGVPVYWSVSTRDTAGLSSPAGVALGPDGALYIADAARHVIFKRTAAGVVSVFAGTLDLPGYLNATGVAARFDSPSALVFDASGNLYVSDTGNNRIRRITSGGVVTLLAGGGNINNPPDGTGAGAWFNYPAGLALSPDGALFVADSGNFTLRRISLPGGVVTTFDTSNGAFDQPTGIAITPDGTLFVSDAGAQNIWRISSVGIATRIAGSGFGFSGSSDGTDSNALFYSPRALALGPDGNVYIADTFNHTLRRVTPGGVVTTLAGLAEFSGSTDGFGPVARLSGPSGLAFAADGTLYIADTENGLVRVATPPPIVPVIAPPSATVLVEGTSLAGYAFTATGSPFTYSATGLPPGVTLNATTGALTGTPLESGLYTVTLSVTNALTTTASSFALTVNAPAWETWRSSVFSAGQLASSNVSGPAADPDFDGVPNLFEYLQDRDPLVRDAAPPLAAWTDGSLSLAFEQLRAAPGWQIVAECSTDLQSWNRGAPHLQTPETAILDARRQQITVRTNLAPGSPSSVFVRLVAEPIP